MKITALQPFLPYIYVDLPKITYFRAREERAAWLQSGRPRRTEDFFKFM